MGWRLALALGLLLAAPQGGAAEKVTPLEKVTKLITDLKAEVEAEGKAEAKTYDEFACFCKSKTMSLSGDITGNQDTIDEKSSDIEAKTTEKEEKSAARTDAKKKKEELSAELEAETARCAQERATYEATNADLTKALSSLGGAMKSLDQSKPSAGLLAVKQTVKKSLALAEAMKIVDQGPQWANAAALLQEGASVDPNSPEYKFHSSGIIEVLEKLQDEFRTKKGQTDAEWVKAKQTCEDTIKGLKAEIGSTENAISMLGRQIMKLSEDIGSARKTLVQTEDLLKDNKLYLEDLTKMCEQRATDWDQRSSLRANELGALSKALQILSSDVSDNEVVNERALLQTQAAPTATAAAAAPSADGPPPSLLQQGRATGASRLRLARGRGAQGAVEAGGAGHEEEARKAHALLVLQQEGGRLGSTALSALAARVAGDPFGKVKGLIQDLVERLIKEATQEATKKGFCDMELAKAKKDRTYRMQEAIKLNGEIQSLQAKEDALSLEIEELTTALGKLKEDLKEATRIRGEEKKENLETIAKGKEGHKAVASAMLTLKSFYGQAAKAKLLQTRASPVDEDTSGAGFEGAYSGKQAASEGIIGILEVIKSDFERTISTTTQDEAEAHAKFVEYERASKADISGKSMKKELDEDDRETARRTEASKMDDLQSNMDLVDSALAQLEELKPTCIDTGMSYEDRIAKREEEIAALKKAMCILDADNIEPECQ